MVMQRLIHWLTPQRLVRLAFRIRPDSEFIVFQGQRLTRRQVFARVEALAAGLQALGVRENDRVATLLPACSDRNCLVRVFQRESLARRLWTKGITSTLVYEHGGTVKGFINFTVHELVSRRGRYCWAWTVFLYWEGLTAKEQQALLAGVWQASREQGCIGIMEWDKNYYAKSALFRARFVPYPHFVEVSAWVVNPDLSFHGIDRIVEQIV